jgi:hypothetical protein
MDNKRYTVDSSRSTPCVIPNERSDNCMDAGGRATLEAKAEEGSPNAAE